MANRNGSAEKQSYCKSIFPDFHLGEFQGVAGTFPLLPANSITLGGISVWFVAAVQIAEVTMKVPRDPRVHVCIADAAQVVVVLLVLLCTVLPSTITAKEHWSFSTALISP